MERTEDKRIQEYFANFQNLDLISEGKSQREINEEKEREKYSLMAEEIIKQNNHIKEPLEKTQTKNNINNTNNINKENLKNAKRIYKSINKKEISKKKIKRKKILQGILLISISAILTVSAAVKLYTHYQTEQIKKEIIVQMYDKYKDKGYDIDNLNMEEIINNTNPKELENDVFGNYLVINKNYNEKEEDKLLNQLVDKAKLADNFNEYLVDEGYHEKMYYSSNGEGYFLEGNENKWANAMEAKYLAEKEQQETKGKGAR